jgi:twinkle protein
MQFQDFDINVKKHSGTEKTYCPKCHKDRSNKRDRSLLINHDEKRWHCFYCGWAGTLNQKSEYKKQDYKIPTWNNQTELSDKVVKYFESRSISQFTLRQNKVTEGKLYIPQISEERNTIQFNYFRNNELINIKYRDAEKNFMLYSGAELILYGLDWIKESKECLITEGEIDMLSYWECGYHAVVSVPNGANKNLQYIDNCFEYFENKEKIYIASDCDYKGFELKEELIRRFGAERCFIVDFSEYLKIKEIGKETEKCKDANEVLINHGKDELLSTIQKAKQIKITGIFEANEVADIMLHTFKTGKIKGTSTHISILDIHWKWRSGDVTIWTGYNSEGKTTLLIQLMVLKSQNDGWKFGLFSPENYPIDELYDELIHCYVGKSTDKDYLNVMTEQEYLSAIEFINEHFFIVCPDEDFQLSTILEKFKYLIKSKGINSCVIDPYNQIEHLMERGEREDLYISRFMSRLKRFSIDNKISFQLVAHQVTPMFHGKEDYPCPDSYKIKGGGTFSDKADHVIAVWRPFRKSNPEDNTVKVIIAKVKKQRLVGIPGEIDLYYNRAKNQYFETQEMIRTLTTKDEPLQSNINFYETDRNDGEPLPF